MVISSYYLFYCWVINSLDDFSYITIMDKWIFDGIKVSQYPINNKAGIIKFRVKYRYIKFDFPELNVKELSLITKMFDDDFFLLTFADHRLTNDNHLVVPAPDHQRASAVSLWWVEWCNKQCKIYDCSQNTSFNVCWLFMFSYCQNPTKYGTMYIFQSYIRRVRSVASCMSATRYQYVFLQAATIVGASCFKLRHMHLHIYFAAHTLERTGRVIVDLLMRK